ncbi:T9SS type A sorting domain-containing protein [Aestuariibaculum sediminum]|uniref:T9SS type A sorting domain-containing protein n=1 Tax=Aestuariibaculum sediminum TaxID=2770637 RepID=A0A8J6Q722_9FLAO|nr:T9SS type A sorting domain-containing protein [Aestuariibaculum sediminum]MBD0832293.1 T9SS type A sorting domain-containing protein [Aestuariibaculum sediminum]
MKKSTLILLAFLVSNLSLLAQTYTTGTINLSSTSGLEYSAQIDITQTEVTLTLIGPSDRWLGIGFGVNSMTLNGDLVIYDGVSMSDRTFQGVGTPPVADSNQDWSIDSNSISSGKRTIVAKRSLNTGEANDYVFSPSDTSINLVWARGASASFALAYHGVNRGATSSGITLSNDEFQLAQNIKIYPIPAKERINLKLPSGINVNSITIYNVLGKETHKVSFLQNYVDISNLNSGIYLLKINTDNSNYTKRFIKL